MTVAMLMFNTLYAYEHNKSISLRNKKVRLNLTALLS